ncbi:hypothetical protein [Kitasatospora camelliae]|uniref:Thioredoxin domain-containing protein n=1 Tax=Kitasatospora camelliae TaxID=3156397 RepID=A0AAU8K8T4_9ACTN
MLPALIALTALLAIATAANLLLTFAVVRRLRAVEEAGPPAPRRPPVGTRVADFTAPAVSGRTVTRADLLGGERVVGFLQVGCGPCADLIDTLAGHPALAALPGYFFVSGDPSDPLAREMAGKLGVLGEVALVGDGLDVPAAFGGVEAFPTLLVVRDALVTASGHDLAALPRSAERDPVGAAGGRR